jgi:hypothetical protein
MRFVLLLGAGFSRNWGGWLADEVSDYLLTCPQLAPSVRNLLVAYEHKGGFEEVLARLQAEYQQYSTVPYRARLISFEQAIDSMFKDMDQAFSRKPFEFQQDHNHLIRTFLDQFDVIFTTNQDLLLERHYLNGNVALSGRWSTWQIPGMRPIPIHDVRDITDTRWTPSGDYVIEQRAQPYIKLHGAWNWIDSAQGVRMLVMGGGKPASIDRFPVLKENMAFFARSLTTGPVRLMVIGYGFRDDHLNRVILQAVGPGELKLFVIDTLGIDALDENRRRNLPISIPSNFFAEVQPHIIGASKRTRRETFGEDYAEHAKVMRFFGTK